MRITVHEVRGKHVKLKFEDLAGEKALIQRGEITRAVQKLKEEE